MDGKGEGEREVGKKCEVDSGRYKRGWDLEERVVVQGVINIQYIIQLYMSNLH